jgi:hypothetical protein
VGDIERVILGRVLHRRPLEVGLPTLHSFLARLVNFFSVLGLWAAPIQIRLGRRRLARSSTPPPAELRS